MTNTDFPEIVGTEWVRYESLYGDLQNLMSCSKKVEIKCAIIVKL